LERMLPFRKRKETAGLHDLEKTIGKVLSASNRLRVEIGERVTDYAC